MPIKLDEKPGGWLYCTPLIPALKSLIEAVDTMPRGMQTETACNGHRESYP